MRTLLFTSEFPPFKGGVANYYGNLVNYWPLGEDLLVLDNNQGDLIKGRGFLSWWPALGILNRKIKISRIEYVLVGQVLPLGTVAWLLSLFKPIKYAVFLHGLDLSSALKSGRKRILARLILNRAARIICNSGYVARETRKFYPQGNDKISIVNPGVAGDAPFIPPLDLAELSTAYNLGRQIVLLSLGRLVRRKGVDMTIQALELLPEPLLNNLKYFIAGVGPEEASLRKLVPDRLKNNIIFLGQLNEEEKWLWLKRCDIFIMPSRDIIGDLEGFGIVYLEANLSGKPVIAGDAGGVRDAVIDGYNGLLVDPENVDDIRGAITKLINDAGLREKLGRDGQERARRDFNWEKQAAIISALIKQ